MEQLGGGTKGNPWVSSDGMLLLCPTLRIQRNANARQKGECETFRILRIWGSWNCDWVSVRVCKSPASQQVAMKEWVAIREERTQGKKTWPPLERSTEEFQYRHHRKLLPQEREKCYIIKKKLARSLKTKLNCAKMDKSGEGTKETSTDNHLVTWPQQASPKWELSKQSKGIAKCKRTARSYKNMKNIPSLRNKSSSLVRPHPSFFQVKVGPFPPSWRTQRHK